MKTKKINIKENTKEVAVVNSSEMMLKGNNRHFFVKRFLDNLRYAIQNAGIKDHKVTHTQGKFFIISDSQISSDDLKEVLIKIPGVENFFFAKKIVRDFDALLELTSHLCNQMKPSTFAVRSRRSDKSYNLTSQQVNEKLGAFIVKLGWKVDLTNPEVTFHIQIMKNYFLLYTNIYKGPGGLPVGVSGKVMALISGGIDSPVAARMLYNRGCQVIFVHFQNQTADTCGVRDKIKKLVEIIQLYQPPTRLYIIPFEKLQHAIIAFCPPKYRMILYRRVMLRITEKIAFNERAFGIVTGDSIGQVASQTLENLRVIYHESKLPVFTPLIGMNKQQTIDLARKFGTYETSILPYNDCCSFMIAKHPATRTTEKEISHIDRSGELATLEKEALEKAEISDV